MNVVYNEDCLDGMKRLSDGSVDFIFTDLPYGVLNTGNSSSAWDKPIDLDRLWKEYWRVLKPDGTVALFGQGMFTEDLMQSQRKYWRYNWTWEKTDGVTGFLNAKKAPLRCTEDICIFYRKLGTYNPQMEYNTGRFNHGQKFMSGGNKCYGKVTRTEPGEITDTHYPKDVLRYPRDNSRGALYPAQKPVALCAYIIRTYSNPGETVLDSCVGSGSSRIAAYQENRNYIGFEMNPDTFRLQEDRFQTYAAQVSFFVEGRTDE